MARVIPRHTLARRGLITLVALAVLGAFMTLRSNGTFGSQPHVTAVVANAGGSLRSGSDVKLNGVIVGKISEIRRSDDGSGVAVDMSMSKDDLAQIPGNVVARILPATVFGTTYVDLVVHGLPNGKLESGSTVPADGTQSTLELQQALDDIDRLVKALGPAELASAIGSAAEALDGRGARLGNTVRKVNAYLARLNPRMPQVRSDIQKLGATLDVVNDVTPDLLTATDDVLVTLNTIVEQQAALTALLSGGTTLARTSTAFLTKNQTNIVRFINGSSGVLDAISDNRKAGITDALAINRALGQALPSTLKEGFVKTDAILDLTPPPYYTSGNRPRYRAVGSSDTGAAALMGANR